MSENRHAKNGAAVKKKKADDTNVRQRTKPPPTSQQSSTLSLKNPAALGFSRISVLVSQGLL